MMRNLQNTTLASALALALAAGSAWAGTATGNLNVTASVDASCTISATPVSFGAYNPTATADHFGNGSVTIACVKDSVPVVALSGGQNQGATALLRSMKHATVADLLAYELFKPSTTAPNTACTATETAAWGVDAADKFTPTGVTLSGSVYNVCGKVTKGQNVAAGAYSDVVIATVEF